MKRIVIWSIVTSLVVASSGSTASAATAIPKGSVSVTASQIKKVGKTNCGYVISSTSSGRSWVPGTLTKVKSKMYFVSFERQAQLISASAKRAAGAKKLALLKSSADYSKKASSGAQGCSVFNPSTPTTTVPVKTLPKPITNRALGRVLATQQQKWSRFEALAPTSNLVVSSLSLVRARLLSTNDVLFKSIGVVALAQVEAAGRTGSGLLAVDSDGATSDALISGQAIVKEFYPGNNVKFYVLFAIAVALVDGGQSCILAEVNRSTGVPTCVDTSLMSVYWPQNSLAETNPPVQFDELGNIYYTGTISNANTVLRKYSNGVLTDLITDNIWLTNFLVLPDGTVLIVGSTASSNIHWVRKLSATGSLSTLFQGQGAYFVKRFADGNIYIAPTSFTGIRRYMVAANELDPVAWVAHSAANVETHVNTSQVCGGVNWQSENYSFCALSGGISKYFFDTPEARTFGVPSVTFPPGPGIPVGPQGPLFQYYPTVERANSVLTNITFLAAVNSIVVLAGTNSAGVNIVTIYDTVSKQETIVLDESYEVEVYNLTYVPLTKKVMYNGLRFADNKFVVGEINLG